MSSLSYKQGILLLSIANFLINMNKPLKYDSEKVVDQNIKIICANGLWGLTNNDVELIPPKYESISDFKNGLAIVELEDKYGLINLDGNEITSIKYSEIRDFYNGFSLVRISGCKLGYYGFINEFGQEICEIKYLSTDPQYIKFINGLAIVSKDIRNNYTLINTFGIEIIPPIFSSIWRDEKYIYCEKGNYIMLLGKYGNLIFDLNNKYQRIVEISESHFAVSKYNEGYAIVNIKNENITKFGYRKFERFSEGLCRRDESNWSDCHIYIYMNYEGHEFTKVRDIVDSLRVVENETRCCGYLNQKGKLVIPCNFNTVTDFYKGKAIVRDHEGKVYFINKKGKKIEDVIDCDLVWDQSEGIYPACFNKLYGFINENGEKICEFRFNHVFSFRRGIAKVELDRNYGLINSRGEIVLDIEYKEIIYTNDGFYKTCRDSEHGLLYGVVDKFGIEILPAQFRELSCVKEGQVIFKSIDYLYGIIDIKQNKILLPAKYDRIFEVFDKNGKAAVKYENQDIYIDEKGQYISYYSYYVGEDNDSSSADFLYDHPDSVWNYD